VNYFEYDIIRNEMKKNEKGKQSLTPTETIGLIKYLGYPPSLYQSLKNSLGREPNLEELSDALLKDREKRS